MTGDRGSDVEATLARLDERVLLALEEQHARIPFTGLKRRLGAHPESLSRALRRLEREGLVERSGEGYRSMRPAPTVPEKANGLRAVARIDLPLGVRPDSVLEQLTGRWFGSLRWMGVVERPDGRLLAWARRDGSGTVLLGVDRASVQLYTSPETGLTEAGESEEAAYELLVAVAEVLRPPRARRPVMFFAAEAAFSPNAGRFGPAGPRAPGNN